MGLRLYPIYFTSSLGRLRQKSIMVNLIPTFFFFKFGKFSGVTNVYHLPPTVDLGNTFIMQHLKFQYNKGIMYK